jgi:tetratricopeptide (TPR) repeat protein
MHRSLSSHRSVRSLRASLLRGARALAVAAALAGLSGCAAAPEVFGTKARYSPAFGGYVMAKEDGSDDPAPSATVLLLRDPVTGRKVRCRDEALQWREIYEDVAVDQIEDAHAGIAAGVTGGLLFGPLLVIQPLGALTLSEAMLSTGALYDDMRTETGEELFARAMVLYRRERYRAAAATIELALAKDPSVGLFHEAYLYAGLAYRRIGEPARAKTALTAFVERAGVRDVEAYRRAEQELAALGVRAKPCGSAGPVDLHW